MTSTLKTALTDSIQAAASKAGLQLVSAIEGKDFHGHPTAVFELAPAANAVAGRTLRLELSEQFDFNKPDLLPAMTAHLAEEAKRLRNPRPDTYVTLEGLPISFRKFQWPFHRSTSGADTYIVHGEAYIEDGTGSPLHAKLSASMTVTFAEIVPAPEQPYAETFVYNAIRKTIDMGQLEFVKSGNRQPVPVTTRYYSRWQKKFIFTDTNDAARLDFLLLKTYWLSGVLGQNQPVWIADPRDAQYLNTTEADLLRMAGDEAGQGLLTLNGEYAAPTAQLMARADEFREKLQKALAITKPQFNEEMRAGHANM
ncbi:hypothetical protein ACFPT7_18185 [Acidicapsa dinghuensis]|uniref:Uncharacterized protein n=1 Tax=Acidicapsa dinghuensis TaxID=2218256 RepID=A0ABW1EJQ9_9BACT|nr:hypothetical protein [Acidicapsa dinghuensis]